jgi:hypothetical protein
MNEVLTRLQVAVLVGVITAAVAYLLLSIAAVFPVIGVALIVGTIVGITVFIIDAVSSAR